MPPMARFEEGCVISPKEPLVEPEANQDDEFTEAEWLIAQEKLRSIERTTGLTFVQRARLRRALSAGGVIEVPVFQQRFGPLPSWLVGPDVANEEEGSGGATGSGSSQEVSSVVDLTGFLEAHALLMMTILGHAAPELTWVQMLARSFYQSAQIRLIGRFRDTGSQSALSGLGEGRVVFQFSPADREGVWTPLSLTMDSGIQVNFFVIGGSTGFQNPADSVEIGGSTGFQNLADSVEIGGSTGVQNLADSVEIGGSTGVQNPADFTEIGAGRGSASSSDLCPNVQVGGSASSTDPCPPTTSFQSGGSSGSHGMAAMQGDWGLCYEDLAEDAATQGNFPMIGTWFQTHYLVHVLSIEGERVLWFLGCRSYSWGCVRLASCYLRYSLATAVVDVLRRDIYGAWFSGPQWLAAVEDYLVTGLPYEGDEVEGDGEAGLAPGPWVHSSEGGVARSAR